MTRQQTFPNYTCGEDFCDYCGCCLAHNPVFCEHGCDHRFFEERLLDEETAERYEYRLDNPNEDGRMGMTDAELDAVQPVERTMTLLTEPWNAWNPPDTCGLLDCDQAPVRIEPTPDGRVYAACAAHITLLPGDHDAE